MKNILFIHQSAELYGSDKTLLLFIKNINRNKFFPVIVLPNDGPLKSELEKLNIKVVIAPVLKLYRAMFTPKNLFAFIGDYRKGISILESINKEYKFDIVYSNTLAILLGLFYSKIKKIKHIWHVHEIIEHPKPIAWIFPKLLYYFTDIIICNSAATKENIVKRDFRNNKKCIIVHNGVEQIEHFNKVIKKDFGFEEKDIIVTLVGRISRLKGHKLLLESYINNFKDYKHTKILFVGSPVEGQEFYLSEIQQIILENNIHEKVKILPFTKSLIDVWQVTDFAIMPSTEKESFGLVAVEAMLASKPVIAANHGGLTEIVVDNETGVLFEPNNVDTFSNALRILIDSEELRISFGKKGYERAIKHFSVESYSNNIQNILKNL